MASGQWLVASEEERAAHAQCNASCSSFSSSYSLQPTAYGLRRTPRRRGILLLVVLSLLVLFAMIAVTFMLLAGNYRKVSLAASKAELVGDDPRREIDDAFGQLIRGTLNPNSSLLDQDLLGDLHGRDGLKVRI